VSARQLINTACCNKLDHPRSVMETRPEDLTRRSIGSRDDGRMMMSVTRLRFTAAIYRQQHDYVKDTTTIMAGDGFKILTFGKTKFVKQFGIYSILQ